MQIHCSRLDDLSHYVEQRLSDVERRKQEDGDRLDELGKRHDEHQQHATDFSETCERQLSQLEIGKQEHQDKFEEVDLDQASFLKHLAVVQDTMQEFLMT